MELYKTKKVFDTSEVTLYDLYYIRISDDIIKNGGVIDGGIYYAICTSVEDDYIIFTPIAKRKELFPSTKSKPFKITSDNVQCIISISPVILSSGHDDCGRWTLQLKERIEMYDI